MIPVLEFNELDDYLAHLRDEQETDWTHLEIGHLSSERDAHGIRAISFFAIATRRFLSPTQYIVVCRVRFSTRRVFICRWTNMKRPNIKRARNFTRTLTR